MKLGINIDHIATLRNARASVVPDLQLAAKTAIDAGAEYIVVHLREDRRHIKDKDLELLCKNFPGHIHLECACEKEMEDIALKLKPFSVCIVPEKPGELTTEGGLLIDENTKPKITAMTAKLKKAGMQVSLFIDHNEHSVRAAKEIGADIIEICTRDYSETEDSAELARILEEIKQASELAGELGLEVHSGHGLNYDNVAPIIKIKNMYCLNIGFSVVAKSVFTGLHAAVKQMKEII